MSQAHAPTGQPDQINVAVVDDDPRLRELLALELEDLGATPTCFPSAKDLLDCKDLHSLQLVLLDLVMPEMDGLTCLLELRQNSFQGRVVLVTANWESTKDYDLMEAGADDCWNKTVALERLAPLLERMRREVSG